jgi:hypothetical protein
LNRRYRLERAVPARVDVAGTAVFDVLSGLDVEIAWHGAQHGDVKSGGWRGVIGVQVLVARSMTSCQEPDAVGGTGYVVPRRLKQGLYAAVALTP